MPRNKTLLTISFYLILGLMACEKQPIIQLEQSTFNNFIGQWDNINVASNEISRLVISQKEVNQLSIQIYGSCGTESCNWGTQIISMEEMRGDKIYLNWEQEEVTRNQELSLTNSGKLQLISEDNYQNNQLDTIQTHFFSRSKSASFYHQIQPEDIDISRLSRLRINGNPNSENQLKPGNILVYQTNEGRLGKMQIRGNDQIVTFRWKTWNTDGTIRSQNDYFATRNNAYYDLDLGVEDSTPLKEFSDFSLISEGNSGPWLIPQEGASFEVYHQEP